MIKQSELKDSNIVAKIRTMVLVMTSAALLIALIAYAAIELISHRQAVMNHLSVLTSMQRTNVTTPLRDNDRKKADQVLSALKADAAIKRAILFLPDGTRFAQFDNRPAASKEVKFAELTWRGQEIASDRMQHRFSEGKLNLLTPVRFEGNLIGYLYIESTLKFYYRKVITFVLVIGVLLIFLLAGLYRLSNRLQRTIYDPIAELKQCMSEVPHKKDYSLRVKADNNDEVGDLIRGFNEMLGRIEKRDLQLAKYRADLENKVEASTVDLLAAKETTESKSKAKSEFMTNMIHAIRTPMNGVLSMIESLLKSVGLNPRQMHLVRTAHNSAETLLNIINDILDLSKIEAGKLQLIEEDFKLRQLLDDVLETVAAEAYRKHLELTTDFALDLPHTLRGDSGRVRQVLVNLLGNAIKFTDEGEVRLSVRLLSSEESRVLISFHVEDRGPGIPLEEQESIFGSLTQADNVITGGNDGTGLRFAIAKQLVEIMGGHIKLESRDGASNRFHFQLYFTHAEHRIQDNKIKMNMHILLADDNKIVHEAVISMLQVLGCRVDLAANGSEALEAARQHRYDLILMDCHMPEMNGFDATANIRQMEQEQGFERCPIIAITAEMNKGVREQCQAAGMDAFLSKPFNQEQMQAILSQWQKKPISQTYEYGASVDPILSVSRARTDKDNGIKSQPRILLVDADPDFRLTTSEMLREAGFSVHEAASGGEAIAHITSRPPNLVLLNAIMEDMDGFEVCRLMTKTLLLDEIPVLIVTASDDVDSVNRSYEVGAAGFVTKPVSYPLLIHRIRFMLRASETAAKLRENQGRLATAQRLARLGYWQWDTEFDHFELSDQLAAMCGIAQQNFGGSYNAYLDHVHPEDRERFQENIDAALHDRNTYNVDYRLQSDDGQAIIVSQELELKTDLAGGETILATVQDVTRQRAAEQQIRKLAYYDPLTGLASRVYMLQRLEERIKSSRRHAAQFALLFLDLDGFKDINDSLGHDAGDQLLSVVAQRLQSLLRETDFAARLGGDEFCMLIDNISDVYDAAEVADRCLRQIDKTVELGTHQLRPRVSIGISLFPRDGENPKHLLKAADSAMYAAKQAGKHRYAFYNLEMTQQAERRLQLEHQLRQALERDEFELLYQPQVSVKTGKVYALEALIRWRHPQRGMIFPAEFIEVAERIGLINRLGDWVLHTACAQAAKWRRDGLQTVRMSINCSPLQLSDAVFVDRLHEILIDTGLKPGMLELEVAESVFQPTGNNIANLEGLTTLGVNIAIDDFGVGYSSLASIRRLPINCLKVDRMFIKDLLDKKQDSILIGTIIGMAHALGYRVVAEGVEQLEQVLALTGMGCDTIQGNIFSQPLPADRIPLLIQNGFKLHHNVVSLKQKEMRSF